MTASPHPSPGFSLWDEPWITVETGDGELRNVGIGEALVAAHTYRGLYDPSPLVVVGIHRLLTAILQAALDPQTSTDLARLWQAQRFPSERIVDFAASFADRFDLFHADAPFLQSADLPLAADREAKPVGYLFPELPTGTAVTHYMHAYDSDQELCAACAARGLLVIPPFASSGGAGIKPSINGVPPLYLVPGGATYWASLTASLVTPHYQPGVAAKEQDLAWWNRPPLIGKKDEVLNVGYLHSLTFPARRVRLHPVPMVRPCTRCGQQTVWSVRTMVYGMGESRPSDAAFWQDPFAAYAAPDAKSGKTAPTPLRPRPGQAVWREFGSLLLAQTDGSERNPFAPLVLAQLDGVAGYLPYDATVPFPFRVVGLRTDGKMKMFEWLDEGFMVSPQVLSDPDAAFVIQRALTFTEEVASLIAGVFRQHFGGESSERERCARAKRQMTVAYWRDLAGPFRQFILDLGHAADKDVLLRAWIERTNRHAETVFRSAAETLGEQAAALRQQVIAEQEIRRRLLAHAAKFFPQEETV